jgi:cell division FtsZ-interacting protein ZapD
MVSVIDETRIRTELKKALEKKRIKKKKQRTVNGENLQQ